MKPAIARLLRNDLARRRRSTDADELPLLDWARRFLPEHTERPFSALHRWLAAELDAAAATRGRKIALLGPRGAAKSTIATLAYPLRRICEAAEPYIWIISDTKTQAETHLENIREELRSNQALRHYYGEANLARSGLWTSNKIQLANGVVAESYGTGQRIRGRRRGAHRPTLIVCDDLQNDSHIYSPNQRANSRAWFHGTLLKAGRSHTNIVNVGTALHREALAVQLLETPGWRTRKFAAIERWPERMDLWQEWERIYCDREHPDAEAAALAWYQQHETHMTAGAEALWPEEEPLYQLMRSRAESGHAAFEREKQNSPIDPDRCEWPEDYFDDRIWRTDRPPTPLRILTLDPAGGRSSKTGDYAAWVLLSIDAAGFGYVDAWLAKDPPEAAIARGVTLAIQHRPTAIGIEHSAFQTMMQAEWNRQARAAGLALPVHGISDRGIRKEIRIRTLGPLFAQRRIFFNPQSAGARELVNQLRDFPIGDHDDGPDALEMAYYLAAHVGVQLPMMPSRLPLRTV